MTFQLTILGNNSAIPAHGRHPTAQVLNIREQLFLIDCGEGTQMRLQDMKVKRSRINCIFISHLHGDHYYGLIGLLTTYNLLQRKNPLHLFAHKPLREIVNIQLSASDTELHYDLIFHELPENTAEKIYENDDVIVESVPLRHRIACTGFLFREKPRPRKIIREKTDYYQVPFSFFKELKKGKDYRNEQGEVIKNEELTADPPHPRAYAYCSDTAYAEEIIPQIKGVDLLYHEATFLQDAEERARETRHTTTRQAAIIAQKAGVKKLLLGHFSAKYKYLDAFLEEAKAVFPDTALAIEGRVFEVGEG